MRSINIYKKIQIILLILIIFSFVIFILSAMKNKKEDNYLAKATYAEATDVVDLKPTETTDKEEIIEDVEDTSWDEEAEDTKVDENKEEISEKKNEMPYYIKINYTANCITIYKKDSSGKYTVPVKAIVCSTGTATPTSGVYKMGQKYRWHELNGGVYGQYCSRITGHILFHSVPYAKNTPDSLKYTAYDKLGTRASAGCIRLTTADAIWIYNNCPSGTYVEFYSSSNPGPLGKPSAQKISSNVECRNWDPTDPTSGNPWHTYKPKEEQNKVQEEPKHDVIEENKQEESKPEENKTNENILNNNSGNDDNNKENNSDTENNNENGNNDKDKENEKNNNTTNENYNETIEQNPEVNENNASHGTTDIKD